MKEEYFYKKTLALLEKVQDAPVRAGAAAPPSRSVTSYLRPVNPAKTAAAIKSARSGETIPDPNRRERVSAPTPMVPGGIMQSGRVGVPGGFAADVMGPGPGKIKSAAKVSKWVAKTGPGQAIIRQLGKIPNPINVATDLGQKAVGRMRSLFRGGGRGRITTPTPTTPRPAGTPSPTPTTPRPTPAGTPSPTPTTPRPTPAGTPPPRGKPPGRTGTPDPPGTPKRTTGAPKGPNKGDDFGWVVPPALYAAWKLAQAGTNVQTDPATQTGPATQTLPQGQQVKPPTGSATGTKAPPRKPKKAKLKIPIPKVVSRGGHVRGKSGNPRGRRFATTTQQGDEDEAQREERSMSNIYKRMGVLLEGEFGDQKRDRDIQKWVDDTAKARNKRKLAAAKGWPSSAKPISGRGGTTAQLPPRSTFATAPRYRGLAPGVSTSLLRNKAPFKIGTPIHPQDIRSGAPNPNPSPLQRLRRSATGSLTFGKGKRGALAWGVGREEGKPSGETTSKGGTVRGAVGHGLIRRGTWAHQALSPAVAGTKDMWRKIRGLSPAKSGGTVGLR